MQDTLKLPDTPEGHCQGTRGEWCGAYYMQVCVEGPSGGGTYDSQVLVVVMMGRVVRRILLTGVYGWGAWSQHIRLTGVGGGVGGGDVGASGAPHTTHRWEGERASDATCAQSLVMRGRIWNVSGGCGLGLERAFVVACVCGWSVAKPLPLWLQRRDLHVLIVSCQEPLLPKPVPRGDKDCPSGCSGIGNCNYDTGGCRGQRRQSGGRAREGQGGGGGESAAAG